MDNEQDICGLCGEPGADKIAKYAGGGVYWPEERMPESEYVHSECEREECQRASDLIQGERRDRFLRECARFW